MQGREAILKTAAETLDQLDKKDTARFVVDLIHRLIMHHGLWFAEASHQVGHDKARALLFEVLTRSCGIQMKRLAATLGFELEDGIPLPLFELDEGALHELRDGIAKNWLVNDGIWFQALEFSRDMHVAKRVNDACWAKFSPVEAESVRRFLGLGERPGLAGLARALEFRLYSCINTQSVVFEDDGSLVLRMQDCRVQSARKRKGLDDYPCKSGGLTEYTTFAETIDPRIRTECIGCPPDAHPEDWFCAWRFTMAADEADGGR
jgi:hypothetical protein